MIGLKPAYCMPGVLLKMNFHQKKPFLMSVARLVGGAALALTSLYPASRVALDASQARINLASGYHEVFSQVQPRAQQLFEAYFGPAF